MQPLQVTKPLDNAKDLGHNLSTISIQPKLTIGPVNDHYEQEADRVAQQVVRQVAGGGGADQTAQRMGEDDEELQAKALSGVAQRADLPNEDDEEALQAKFLVTTLQRQATPEEEEQELQPKRLDGTLQRQAMPTEEEEEPVQPKSLLQRSADGSMAATPALEEAVQRARGHGHALPAATRQPMEHAFGADFSRVKVHSDAQADQLNRSIQARAFTTGQDIFMRQGEYSPDSRSGQELLAHELTHVVQQNQEVTR